MISPKSAAANYNESLVPAYELPDPLVSSAGESVTSAATWRDQRRGEILKLFEDHVYGHMPGPFEGARMELLEEDRHALAGRAVRRQTRIHFGDDGNAPTMDLLLYLPAGARSVPVFLGSNFNGNHTIHTDAGILLSKSWIPRNDEGGVVDHRATESARGSNASRWSVERILERGYGLATVYCGDVEPDFDDGYANGVHPLFYQEGQTRPESRQWGSIGAWAWGLSRGFDILQQDNDVDTSHVAVMGHSRLGKTALWAGACDERFAMVISNNSGCDGAALSRRRFGETVAAINTSFPHWFCDHHHTYNDREAELPVDQHELIALAAPRPVYVNSASRDRWADPRGEFLGAVHASSVYELLGKQGLATEHMPDVDEALLEGHIGYHVRTGGHDVTEWDWDRWMDFADRRWST
jgi:hypothetical protein